MKIVFHQFPIADDELDRIVHMLRHRDVLTPGFDKRYADVYDPLIYLVEKDEYDTDTFLLADRNLLTRWINLTKVVSVTDEVRVAAALLAFCQCCGILVEPSIALYEVAAESENETASYEEAVFRMVDNAHPQVLAEIALGQSDSAPMSFISAGNISVSKNVDFTMPLNAWRMNYVLALKVAALSLSGGKTEFLTERLFDWMYSQYVFLAPSTVLALFYFSPNSPKKGLFKQIRSEDRERAIAGIKNATWDLTLIHHWVNMVRNQRTNKTINLLGSLDKKLHTIARSIIAFTDSDEVSEAYRRELFDRLLGKVNTGLYPKIVQYYKDSENPIRL
ncbi:MAG: hypothetical protein HGB19_04220, partial [Chlorobiales bacterium]|nr:hypothetical protein [Chlorobiales bacterium]